MPSNLLREYFSYSKKERTGITVFLVLIGLLTIMPFFLPFFIHHSKTDDTVFRKAIATLKWREADSGTRYAKPGKYNSSNNTYAEYNRPDEKPEGSGHYQLFYFDPNTLDAEGWQKLGIREKTIGTIQHYLSKGGRFKSPDDIRKIWGLHADEVERLLPYVKIEAAANSTANKTTAAYTPYVKKEKSFSAFDINTADTSAFIALPGIGSKLAARIIAFRDKLGGFYTPEQVAETFGLPDSTFQKIKNYLLVTHPRLKIIHINTAGAEELKAHPYIRYNLAQAIIQYRNQHGRFGSVADIKKIMSMDEVLFIKLAPYLSVE